MLAKEIAYQWAKGKILKECKLLFLLYLRDLKLQKINSIEGIVYLFTSENASVTLKNTKSSDLLVKYVTESYGVNVSFVLDGFDECPVAVQKESVITNLIKGKDDGRNFLNAVVIITSWPTATLFLHRRVDRRIEILGFAKEEWENYISLSLRDSLGKIQELDKYLKHHLMIDNLCYIPLYLAILMYLFQQDSLPETLTEMNEYFIINTIYRYMERKN